MLTVNFDIPTSNLLESQRANPLLVSTNAGKLSTTNGAWKD